MGEKLQKYVAAQQMPLAPNDLPMLDETVEDVGETTYRYIHTHYLWQTAGILVITAVLSIVAVWAVAKGWDARLLIVPFILPIVAFRWVRERIHSVFMKQFADANGFHFQRRGTLLEDEAGSVFNRGRAKKISNIAEGKFLGRPLQLFNYKYTEGRGRSSRNFQYTIFELEFLANLPRMYLDAHQEGNNKSPGWRLNNLERISLESNEFNKNFTLWAEPGTHLDALRVFTPDLMSELLKISEKLDFELVGDQIYIYADGLVTKKYRLQYMFTFAKHLMANLGYVLERMRPV